MADEMTGLPELPEGCFWRVVPTYNFYTNLFSGVKLVLMHRRKGWFLTHEEELRRTDYAYDGRPDDVREWLKSRAEELHEWFVKSGETLEFVGDYPPKNINN